MKTQQQCITTHSGSRGGGGRALTGEKQNRASP